MRSEAVVRSDAMRRGLVGAQLKPPVTAELVLLAGSVPCERGSSESVSRAAALLAGVMGKAMVLGGV